MDTTVETGDGPFCSWDNIAATGAIAPRCSESKAPPPGRHGSGPVDGQDECPECVLQEHGAVSAPIARLATATEQHVYGRAFTLSTILR